MSKDGKKFSFSSNFDTPSGLAKFETAAEVALLRADDKPCIYEYKSKNSNDQIVVTGCENEIREMQIQHKNSAPFYGKIHPDGKVDEIELPPRADKVLYPDDYEKDKNTDKTKSFRELSDAAQNAQLPPCMDLELYLYYGPSFERTADSNTNAETKARRIASHAKNHYLSPEFPTKINVITTVQRLEKDADSIQSFGPLVPKRNHKKGRLHALLIGEGLSGSITGMAWVDTACWPTSRQTGTSGPYSITKVVGSDMNTAETLAHEMAHNLGIEHDFQTARRGSTCGPGQWVKGGALMNYGRPFERTWSKCSSGDFIRYFQSNQPFCLKTSELFFKFCCIAFFTLLRFEWRGLFFNS